MSNLESILHRLKREFRSKMATKVNLVEGHDRHIMVRYHNTVVCRIFHDRIELEDSGYKTLTTKARMNDCLRLAGYPFRVYQKLHVWFIWDIERKFSVDYDSNKVVKIDQSCLLMA